MTKLLQREAYDSWNSGIFDGVGDGIQHNLVMV